MNSELYPNSENHKIFHNSLSINNDSDHDTDSENELVYNFGDLHIKKDFNGQIIV